jgi:ribonuclease HI
MTSSWDELASSQNGQVVDLVDEHAVNIYADGSSLPTPRRGGIGIRFVWVGDDGYEQTDDHSPPGYKAGTNQEMELQACIEGLRLTRKRRTEAPVDRFDRILIHSDSRYVVDNVKTALYSWQGNGWQTRDGAPVENAKLWDQLVSEIFRARKRVEFTWVKSHKDSAHNKAADRLARQSAQKAVNDPLHVGVVRRKVTSQQAVRGSVVPNGQLILIRVIEDRFLPRQKVTRYRYEVTTRSSPDFGKVDFAYSNLIMKSGHHYRVRLNTDPKNPRVAEVLEEVEGTSTPS